MTARSFDYSKWDNIELSDDESDLHPNIDKESWFRMKHRSRLEREAREDVEIKEMKKQNEQDAARIKVVKARLARRNDGEDAEYEDYDALQGELTELELRIQSKQKKIDQIMEKRSWNIDNICHVKEEKTFVNSANISSLKAEDFEPTGVTEAVLAQKETSTEPSSTSTPSNDTLPTPPSNTNTTATNTTATKATTATTTTTAKTTPPTPPTTSSSSSSTTATTTTTQAQLPLNPKKSPKQAALSYNDYVLTHEQLLERYSEISSIEETKEFLVRHCDILLHEHSQSYILLSCLEDEMNGKHKRMKLVCRQSQILSHITELAQSMKRDPRDVIIPFFIRIQEPEHFQGFTNAVDDFVDRIKKRAVEKRREMDMERRREAVGDNVPLGPGGLNPLEVLEQLPESMRNAFDSQDIGALHRAVAEMKPSEARKWMKMCVDSGLWVPSNSNEFDDNDDPNEDENVC
eukprot:CAMPEP_0174820822 /NCGR_PEP_ID=MMETSP1107-20130205/4883_1 /TAXON_ID=36770 /ORGANISM="Paraphysomonas vestita, Strain GFlagA" /LENGTH=461 /DNA_ID=CAMNT_0016036875 /DNA_START=2093 /DNA_END=3478 /DNA_ORIENTATION=+